MFSNVDEVSVRWCGLCLATSYCELDVAKSYIASTKFWKFLYISELVFFKFSNILVDVVVSMRRIEFSFFACLISVQSIYLNVKIFLIILCMFFMTQGSLDCQKNW